MIRRATTDDIPAIREMARVVFPRTYAPILSGEQIDYMMEMMYSERSLLEQMGPAGHIFFIDGMNGYVSYRRDGVSGDGRALYHLEKLYVMPRAQKMGLGKRLFDTVVKAVKADSPVASRIELNVNRLNPAVSFYEHLGMHRDHQGDFPIGGGYFMNDYIMAVDL